MSASCDVPFYLYSCDGGRNELLFPIVFVISLLRPVCPSLPPFDRSFFFFFEQSFLDVFSLPFCVVFLVQRILSFSEPASLVSFLVLLMIAPRSDRRCALCNCAFRVLSFRSPRFYPRWTVLSNVIELLSSSSNSDFFFSLSPFLLPFIRTPTGLFCFPLFNPAFPSSLLWQWFFSSHAKTPFKRNGL